MPRDSFYGEQIIWQGRPELTQVTGFLRALALISFVTTAIGVSFAAVIQLSLGRFPLGLLAFSSWCGGLGACLLVLPRRFAEGARYFVTERRVVVKYGPFTRSIERRAITFARIYWNDNVPNTGDLEVVRAVPAGALRRRLRVRLSGLVAPDRVWAIVRGAEGIAPARQAEHPVGQRLDTDEWVVWSARSRPKLRTFLPQGQREWALLGFSAFLLFGVSRMVSRVIPVLERLAEGALPANTFSFFALSVGLALATLLMLAIAGYLAYDAVIRNGLRAKDTRYLVTNKRVLIQRRSEELHLDREKIVDVIDAPAGAGLRDVFLVLDGPQASALAASGAFGELARGPNLRPVFESVEDAESVTRILRTNPVLREAA